MIQDEIFSVIRTGDGTDTLFSEEYSQAMHTLDGAYSEAVVKHVIPSKVLEKKEAVLRVLEVGFGIGYNVMALLERFMLDTRGRFLEVVTLEKNCDALASFKGNFDDKKRQQLFEMVKILPEKKNIKLDCARISLIEGDARRAVQTLGADAFHAIFHDPYSPSKNPEMWTVEFFGELFRVAKNDCVLTTYSSAPQIRSALLEAGFFVGKGPGMGKKREGTIASKGECIEILSDEECAALRLHRQSIPYRDASLSSSREEILQRRKEEMKRIRLFNLEK